MIVNLTNTKSNRFLQIKNYYLDTFNATNSSQYEILQANYL